MQPSVQLQHEQFKKEANMGKPGNQEEFLKRKENEGKLTSQFEKNTVDMQPLKQQMPNN